jgi:hypothetical protein
MRWVAALVSTVLTATLVSGCMGLGLPDDDGASPRCPGGRTQPLAIADVARTLKHHGFSVGRDDGSALCSAQQVAAVLTNIHFDGPHENISAHDEISEREGHVSCAVERRNVSGTKLRTDLHAPAASPIFSGRKARFWLANIDCVIYPEGPTTERNVKRLELAMKQLERLVRK